MRPCVTVLRGPVMQYLPCGRGCYESVFTTEFLKFRNEVFFMTRTLLKWNKSTFPYFMKGVVHPTSFFFLAYLPLQISISFQWVLFQFGCIIIKCIVYIVYTSWELWSSILLSDYFSQVLFNILSWRGLNIHSKSIDPYHIYIDVLFD